MYGNTRAFGRDTVMFAYVFSGPDAPISGCLAAAVITATTIVAAEGATAATATAAEQDDDQKNDPCTTVVSTHNVVTSLC